MIGFDDAPFARTDANIHVSGVVCSNTRFEGMLWGEATRDGLDATDSLAEMVLGSKYHAQLHAVLIDGLAVGGMNLIDLPELATRLELPCIAVMRRAPDLEGMRQIIAKLPEPELRLERLMRGGPIHERAPFVYQVAGIDPDEGHQVLERVTDTGHVPEALRLAHHIGAAIKTGQSGRRA